MRHRAESVKLDYIPCSDKRNTSFVDDHTSSALCRYLLARVLYFHKRSSNTLLIIIILLLLGGRGESRARPPVPSVGSE